MHLTKTPEGYACVCTYDTRHIPKEAGFTWHGPTKRWITADPSVAAKLLRFADESCKAELETVIDKLNQSLVMSSAKQSMLEVPKPYGLQDDYLPFQKAGIEFAIQRNATLIGDQPGCGKTVEVCGFINLKTDINRILVICPATLKLNWKSEMEKWLVRARRIHVINGGNRIFKPDDEITIINYDVLEKYEQQLLSISWDLIVADESHYIKSPKTKRSKSFLKLNARYKLALSGTPILNRPIEIFTTLKWLDPKVWNNAWVFMQRYCGLKQTRFGYDYSGASNTEELAARLRSTLMVRRLKADVLVELPPKFRQVIELSQDGLDGLIEQEWDSYKRYEQAQEALRVAVQLAKAAETDEDYEEAVHALRQGQSAAFTEMARLRKEIAVSKIPYMIEHLKELLDDGIKVVFFAHHHEVLLAIQKAFPNSVLLYGGTFVTNRKKAIDAFQNDENVRLFIGGMKAAGVGITLTASSHVVFGELDWVPATLSQAEDRVHRYTQINNVLVQHLVLEGSLDSVMAKRMIEKQKVIDSILNTEASVASLISQEEIGLEEPATQHITRKEVVTRSPKLEPQDVFIIHQCLRTIASMCDGAHSHDAHGFNKLDADIGRSLANQTGLSNRQAYLGLKLAWRYRKQLGPETAEALNGIQNR